MAGVMYSSDKTRGVVDMLIEVGGNSSNGGLQSQEVVEHQHSHQNHLPQHQLMLGESSGEDGYEAKAPKKRAETWVLEETRSLIALRRETDLLFNTSKSNKHLWEQISMKMRAKGFDRSAVMCTDKWRNLLKEFKKIKSQDKGAGAAKMAYYKEIEELLNERNNNAASSSKSHSYIPYSDKALDDTSLQFGPEEVTARASLNLERRLDHDGHPLAITGSDAAEASAVPPWNWRTGSANGMETQTYTGRVIFVKWGEFTRRIGIDCSAESIIAAIKCTFALRTGRSFCLIDEEDVVRGIDRDMPLGTYTLHLDEGYTIRICTLDESTHIPISTSEMTLYTENDFKEMLHKRSWVCLKEFNETLRVVETLNCLQSGSMYRGLRLGES